MSNDETDSPFVCKSSSYVTLINILHEDYEFFSSHNTGTTIPSHLSMVMGILQVESFFLHRKRDDPVSHLYLRKNVVACMGVFADLQNSWQDLIKINKTQQFIRCTNGTTPSPCWKDLSPKALDSAVFSPCSVRVRLQLWPFRASSSGYARSVEGHGTTPRIGGRLVQVDAESTGGHGSFEEESSGGFLMFFAPPREARANPEQNKLGRVRTLTEMLKDLKVAVPGHNSLGKKVELN